MELKSMCVKCNAAKKSNTGKPCFDGFYELTHLGYIDPVQREIASMRKTITARAGEK
jgi:hypothetical protein